MHHHTHAFLRFMTHTQQQKSHFPQIQECLLIYYIPQLLLTIKHKKKNSRNIFQILYYKIIARSEKAKIRQG